uniref:Lipocalin n=1 Tax=Rhipicephalus zambeziensis TaxID=60191 RepID=A0A224YMD6_9ACAR
MESLSRMKGIPANVFVCAFAFGNLAFATDTIPKSKIDGWTFFNRSLDFEMQKRNYIPTSQHNETLCVTAAFKQSDNGPHNITKVFFYRNLSSTDWPVANITMKFVNTTNTTRYNTVQSRITIALHGYSLPAPHWRFLYVEENCTVVKVLSKKSPAQRMAQKKQSPHISKYCELWAVQRHHWRSESYKAANASSLCEKAFSSMCENTTIYTVWESQYCGPKSINKS